RAWLPVSRDSAQIVNVGDPLPKHRSYPIRDNLAKPEGEGSILPHGPRVHCGDIARHCARAPKRLNRKAFFCLGWSHFQPKSSVQSVGEDVWGGKLFSISDHRMRWPRLAQSSMRPLAALLAVSAVC